MLTNWLPNVPDYPLSFFGPRWEFACNFMELYAGFMARVGPRTPELRSTHNPTFGLYVNVREDYQGSPIGYGLPESRDERAIVRALLLLTDGNTLVLDWGVPSDFALDPTWDTLLERTERMNNPYYVFPDAFHRRGLAVGQPQVAVTHLARNGHFFPPIHHTLEEMPPGYVERIYRGVDGELFTAEQLKRGWWIGWWIMYYAADGYSYPYHTSKLCPWFQKVVLRRYEQFSRFWNSSTVEELVLDALLVCVYGWVVGAVTAWATGAIFGFLRILVWSPVEVFLMFIACEIYVWYRWWNRMEEADRPSRLFQAQFLGLAAFRSSFIGFPVLLLLKVVVWSAVRLAWAVVAHFGLDLPRSVMFSRKFYFVQEVMTLAVVGSVAYGYHERAPVLVATWGDAFRGVVC